ARCHTEQGAGEGGAFRGGAGLAADIGFGGMAAREIERRGERLAPAGERIRLGRASDSPRAASPEELLRRFAPARPDARAAANIDAALEELLAGRGAASIIVAGSLYLVGEARSRLLSGRWD